jgi:hypothetical protein
MSNWYEEMAAAIKKRDVALAAVNRWQEKVTEAEAEIAALGQKSPAVPTVPTVSSVPAPTMLPSDYADSAE